MNLRCAEFCSNLLQNYYMDPGAHWTNANSKKHSYNDWKYVGAGKDIIFLCTMFDFEACRGILYL